MITVLAPLLSSADVRVQYYCTSAFSNIAVDATNRRELTASELKLIMRLIELMASPVTKVQYQAITALRNLACDASCQRDIVRGGGKSQKGIVFSANQ